VGRKLNWIALTAALVAGTACSSDPDPDGDADVDGPPDSEVSPEAEVADPVCGNGEVETGEECDDGNETAADGCEPVTCVFTCHADEECEADPEDGPCYGVACRAVESGGRLCAPGANPGVSCDDGLFCNGVDACGEEGTCVHPGDPCAPGTEACNEADGRCDPGGCTIDGAFVPEGTVDPTDECRRCRRADAEDAWSPKDDFTPCTLVTDPDRAYDVCVGGTCVSPGCGDVDCNTPGPAWDPADTGQRQCANATDALTACPGTAGGPTCTTTPFCGQDAQYGWDVDHAATERFTRSTDAEPVVADEVTGLVWQGCVAGRAGTGCAGGSPVRLAWDAAVAHCEALAWNGLDDWRLPDRFELQSILDYGRASPAIDATAFPGTPNERYWSSTASAGGIPGSWYAGLDSIGLSFGDRGATLAFRCVRGGVRTVAPVRFERTEPAVGESVVTDAVAGLVWQGCVAGLTGADCDGGTAASATWQEALARCEGLSWGGLTDWRLPDAKELATLVADRREFPAVDPALFPGFPDGVHLWSATSFAGLLRFAWGLVADRGSINILAKGEPRAVLCVRREP
jgi:cysteine-rich repeat protein